MPPPDVVLTPFPSESPMAAHNGLFVLQPLLNAKFAPTTAFSNVSERFESLLQFNMDRSECDTAAAAMIDKMKAAALKGPSEATLAPRALGYVQDPFLVWLRLVFRH